MKWRWVWICQFYMRSKDTKRDHLCRWMFWIDGLFKVWRAEFHSPQVIFRLWYLTYQNKVYKILTCSGFFIFTIQICLILDMDTNCSKQNGTNSKAERRGGWKHFQSHITKVFLWVHLKLTMLWVVQEVQPSPFFQ